MNWLLKITEGPMKGAEVALPGGSRVTFGRAASCDIVVADQALADEAFALDVSDSSVTLIPTGGEGETLRPFEVHAFGATAIAIGPAEGTWEALREPPPKEEKPVEEAPAEATAPAAEAAPAAAAAEETHAEKKGGCLRVVAWGIAVVLLLLAAALAFLWFGPYKDDVQARVKELLKVEQRQRQAAPAVQLSLKDIAAQYRLRYTEADGVKRLAGNVKRRTERLAIRALAQAADCGVTFDLTDDETLFKAAEELLFAVTEGAIRAVSASNRVVAITGRAEDSAALEHVVRALSADVKGLEKLDTKGVHVGVKMVETAAPRAKPAAPVYSLTKPRRDASAPKPVAVAKPAARKPGPIAGILTKPYACVVMASGLRLTEGAQIGSATIEKIEADRLVLRDGDSVFEWKP